MKCRNLVGDRKGLTICLAVTTALRARRRLQILAYDALAELAAEDLEIMGLVARCDIFEALLQLIGFENEGWLGPAIGKLVGSQLAHEFRGKDGACGRKLIGRIVGLVHRTSLEHRDFTREREFPPTGSVTLSEEGPARLLDPQRSRKPRSGGDRQASDAHY